MPSLALQELQGTRSVQLDELDAAHGAVGGAGPGRRYATRQLNHAYTVVLAAQFQGFCRDLHSESADMVAGAIGSLSPAGMVNSSAVADLVSTAKQLHVRTGSRLRRLEQLNVWVLARHLEPILGGLPW